jgi:hypothetical protein
MIIVKIILILIWILGAIFFYLVLPNTKVEQWIQFRLSCIRERVKGKEKPTSEKKVVAEKVVIVEEMQDEEEKASEKEEEVDFSQVEIFSEKLTIREGFYASLTPSQKLLFDQMYILDHPSHLVNTLQFNPKGDNVAFFTYVFNSLYTYRKIISLELLKVLTEELLFLAKTNAQTQSILYEIAIRTAYFRRKDPAFLAYAQTLSEKDVELNRTHLKRKQQYVYSYTRLAIILEKKKAFKEALAIVDEALNLQLVDKTVQGYQGRKERILVKMQNVK